MKINLPDSLDLKDPQKYNLYIQTGADHFSFSICNIRNNNIFHHIILESTHPDAFSNFREVFYENDFFNRAYKKVYVVNSSRRFTFVPSAIFEEKNKEFYFNFNFSTGDEIILHQQLKNPELTILHAIPENVYDFLVRSIIPVEFIHIQSPLITYFQNKILMGGEHKMVANIREKGMDIICYSHESFILGNHFTCYSENDFEYYILFIWKQLKFSQLKDFLYVAGLRKNSPIVLMLKNYLQNIIFIDEGQTVPYEISIIGLCEL